MTPYNVTDNNIYLPVNPNNRKSETIGILVASDFKGARWSWAFVDCINLLMKKSSV